MPRDQMDRFDRLAVKLDKPRGAVIVWLLDHQEKPESKPAGKAKPTKS